MLAYYENKQSSLSNIPKPIAVLNLGNIQKILNHGLKDIDKVNKYVFELVCDDRTYTLGCLDEKISNLWIKHISQIAFGNITHKGWLLIKNNKSIKTQIWKNQWFTLSTNKQLRYYNDQTINAFKGSIDLDCVSVMRYGDKDQYNQQYVIEIILSKQIMFVLVASDNQSRELWMKEISTVISGKYIKIKILYAGYLWRFQLNDKADWIIKYYCIDQETSKLYQISSFCKSSQFYSTIVFDEMYYDENVDNIVESCIPIKNAIINKYDNDDIRFINTSQQLNTNIFQIKNALGEYYFAADNEIALKEWIHNLNVGACSRVVIIHAQNQNDPDVNMTKVYSQLISMGYTDNIAKGAASLFPDDINKAINHAMDNDVMNKSQKLIFDHVIGDNDYNFNDDQDDNNDNYDNADDILQIYSQLVNMGYSDNIAMNASTFCSNDLNIAINYASEYNNDKQKKNIKPIAAAVQNKPKDDQKLNDIIDIQDMDDNKINMDDIKNKNKNLTNYNIQNIDQKSNILQNNADNIEGNSLQIQHDNDDDPDICGYGMIMVTDQCDDDKCNNDDASGYGMILSTSAADNAINASGNDINISCEGNDNDNDVLCQIEFARFLSTALGKTRCDKYLPKFIENESNDIRFVDPDMFDDELLNEIKMKKLDKKLLIKRIHDYKTDYYKFENLLNDLKMKEKYHTILVNRGIATYESFYYHLKSQKDVQNAINNTQDAIIIFNALYQDVHVNDK